MGKQSFVFPIKLSLGLLLIAGGVFIFNQAVFAAFGDTGTFLGKMYTGDNGPAIDAYLDMPQGFTHDGAGNIYIADTNNNVIRKIDANNIITTFAGTGEWGRQDGSRALASFGYPKGIAYSSSDGSFFVADAGSSRIRKIDSAGKVTTLTVTGAKALSVPEGIIISGSDLYIADTGNNRIVKVSKSGGALTEISTGLSTPMKIVQGGDNLYVADFGSGKIIKINISTKAKTVLASGFTEPRAITYYNGNIYVTAGENGVWNEIWRISPTTGDKTRLAERRETEWLNMGSDIFIREDNGTPRIYILQGGGSSIFTFDINGKDMRQIAGKHRYGDETGNAGVALIGHPQDVAFSPNGKILYIVYSQGNKIAKYDLWNDELTHLAGNAMDNYLEAAGETARFSDVISTAMSADGKTLYLVDRNNNRIRSLNVETGQTSYITGAGEFNSDSDSNNGYQEGGPCDGQFSLGVSGCAYFNRPTGLALTSDGKTLYIADGSNNRIRKVVIATGQTSLIAGSGASGFVNGIGNNATFNGPFTVALSSDNKTLYVADKYNHAVRAINLANNQVTTLVGTGKQGYKEGSFKEAVLGIPENIKRGPDGNLYVSEAGSLRVRKLDLTAQRTSLVSGSGERGKVNGTKEVAEWDAPKGMAFLNTTLYVTDFRNDLIRTIDLDSTVPSPRDTVAPGKSFMAYNSKLRGGWAIAVGNVMGDEAEEIITGTGQGFGPQVRIFDKDGKVLGSFFAYDSALRVGVRITTGDLDGDGYDEIITVPGPGATPLVKIYDAKGNPDVDKDCFYALDGKFKGGAYVASGDVNGNGLDEIIVTAGKGGGAQVTVHQADGRIIGNFFAYDKNTFRGGITVATFDSDGDGKDEIITGPEFGSPHIQFFTLIPGQVKRLNPGFYAFDSSYKGGVSVAGADYDGNGTGEIIVGSGIGMDTYVRIYNKRQFTPIKEIRPYAKGVTGGLIVAAGDVDKDGKAEIVTMPRSNGGPNFRVLEE
ncbi:MAG: hypothetical protein PHH01_03055 [Patescibacteria group bacterium]|nr:hypothetical protein [Patescibacteria group bacterium]